MKERTCLTKRNIYLKILERLSKYKNLEVEIDRMLNMTTTTILVVTGVLSLDMTGMEKCRNKISGNIKKKRYSKYHAPWYYLFIKADSVHQVNPSHLLGSHQV